MHKFLSLNMVSPHLLHWTLTSDEKISTSSPHRGHFLIVRVGVRKCDVPGQLPNNVLSPSKRVHLGSRLQSLSQERKKKRSKQFGCARMPIKYSVGLPKTLRRRALQRSPRSLSRDSSSPKGSRRKRQL